MTQFAINNVDTEADLKNRSWMLDTSVGHWVFITRESIIKGFQLKLARRLGYGLAEPFFERHLKCIMPDELPGGMSMEQHDKIVSDYFDNNTPDKVLQRSGVTFFVKNRKGELLRARILLHPFSPDHCDGVCFANHKQSERLIAGEIIFNKDVGL